MSTTFDRPMDFRAAAVALSRLFKIRTIRSKPLRVAYAMGGASAERMYSRISCEPRGQEGDRGASLAPHASLRHEEPRSVARRNARPRVLGFLALATDHCGWSRDREASTHELDDRVLDDDRKLFTDRLRDMHDLRHVVAGYRGDLIGEAAVLGLSFMQTKNPGIGLISGLGFLKFGALGPNARRIIFRAFWRARRAAWLPAVDWEAMLSRPLDEVRPASSVSPTYRNTKRSTRRRSARAGRARFLIAKNANARKTIGGP